MALQNGEMNVNVSQASLAGQHTKMRHIAVKGSLSHQNEQIETHNVETEGSIRPSGCTMARNWKGVKACEGSGVRNCVIPHKQHVFIIRVPAGSGKGQCLEARENCNCVAIPDRMQNARFKQQ